VNRESADTKIAGMCERVDEFEEEMQHRYSVSRMPNPLIRYTWDKMDPLQDFSFLLAIVINILILLAYGVKGPTADLGENPSFKELVDDTFVGKAPLGNYRTDAAIRALGAIQTAVAVLVLILFCVNFARITIRRRWVTWTSQMRLHQAAKVFGEPAVPKTLLGYLLRHGPDKLQEYLHRTKGATSDTVVVDSDEKTYKCTHMGREKPLDLTDLAQYNQRRKAHKTVPTPLYLVIVTYAMNLFFLVTNGDFCYYLTYVLFAFLGDFSSPFFFAFHLLDLIHRFETLKVVVRSVTYNGSQLVMTVVLVVVVVYLYAIVAFNIFRESFQADGDYVCETMYQCYFFTLTSGLRAAGGIGDSIIEASIVKEEGLYFSRLVYDLTFFAFVSVVLVNGVVFGIIIDTFGDLRGQTKDKAEDMAGKCFICGIGREEFDRNANGFENHFQNDHNLWSYVFLLIHLRRMDPTEMNGLESHIYTLARQQDNSWVPIQRALCLQTVEEEKSELREVQKQLTDLAAEITKMKAAFAPLLKK